MDRVVRDVFCAWSSASEISALLLYPNLHDSPPAKSPRASSPQVVGCTFPSCCSILQELGFCNVVCFNFKLGL